MSEEAVINEIKKGSICGKIEKGSWFVDLSLNKQSYDKVYEYNPPKRKIDFKKNLKNSKIVFYLIVFFGINFLVFSKTASLTRFPNNKINYEETIQKEIHNKMLEIYDAIEINDFIIKKDLEKIKKVEKKWKESADSSSKLYASIPGGALIKRRNVMTGEEKPVGRYKQWLEQGERVTSNHYQLIFMKKKIARKLGFLLNSTSDYMLMREYKELLKKKSDYYDENDWYYYKPIIYKGNFNELRLNANEIFEKLYDNGWGKEYGRFGDQMRLLVNLSEEENQMKKTFGERYEKIVFVIRQNLKRESKYFLDVISNISFIVGSISLVLVMMTFLVFLEKLFKS